MNPQGGTVNISEEMSRTAIWKQLAGSESDPNAAAASSTGAAAGGQPPPVRTEGQSVGRTLVPAQPLVHPSGRHVDDQDLARPEADGEERGVRRPGQAHRFPILVE